MTICDPVLETRPKREPKVLTPPSSSLSEQYFGQVVAAWIVAKGALPSSETLAECYAVARQMASQVDV